MLPSGDVEKVVVINKDFAEIFIKKEKLDDEKYKDVSQTKLISGVNEGPHYDFTIGSVDAFVERLNKFHENKSGEQIIDVKYDTRTDWRAGFFSWMLPILIIVAIWLFIMRKVSGGAGGPGGQIFNIGKSKATLFDKDTNVNVTFNDVAGLDEAKEEIMEVVDFLKHPKKYTALGGKIPKGCLLVGPPGTGKTLIAKAMAGEAQVPFFSISGSDFVEMFVGVGASRVRDLFKQAREKAPCIIFIDEIDAIGRARGKNVMQGNDERENTLNQLLVEMDGFSSEKGVIIIAATNRPDVLDSALMRPGRFDRQIAIDKPDLKGREKIFQVHVEPLKSIASLDVHKLASQTPGFVGLERKNKIISPDEREVIAYHEAGHAVCGWYLEHAHPLLKVSIVPRGVAALGYAQYIPKEQYLYNTEQLMDEICMTLGGRVAEEIIFDKISTGAQNDLEKITKLAYGMVSIYGMNDKVGNVSFNGSEGEYNFKKPYSEETATLIDEEVRALIEVAHKATTKLLTERKKELTIIAKKLLEKEILFKSDLEDLIGIRPFDDEPAPVAASPTAIASSDAKNTNPTSTDVID
ncbi:UNVERIFIED_CONTAM: hypothetical protein GTU68_021166 [Idotea baltica]|nr:hypothetical protein [Idotea baltica]